MNLIIKFLLAALWLLAVPCATGLGFLRKNKSITPGEGLLAGYVFMLTVMEVLALPMVYLKLPLHVLRYAFAIVMAVSALGGLFLVRKRAEEMIRKERDAFCNLSFWGGAAVVVILVQLLAVTVLAHMDADDAFYVATATTGVHTDTIFSVNPYTGYEYAKLPSRYVLSQFPAFLSVVSSLCGLHPAVMAHVIFPPVFVLLAYLALHQYGKRWFSEDRKARGLFLLFAALIVWFSAYSIYNAQNFEMIRIWQGKAAMAAVFLPFLIYLCLNIIMEREKQYSWMLLLCANVTCCLLSSMGIILSCFLTGIFVAMGLMRFRDLERAAKGALCCVPSLLLGVLYILIR